MKSHLFAFVVKPVNEKLKWDKSKRLKVIYIDTKDIQNYLKSRNLFKKNASVKIGIATIKKLPHINPKTYLTISDTTVIDDAIKFSDNTIMSTLAPHLTGSVIAGLSSSSEDSITVWPNTVWYPVSFDSIAIISDTDDETFTLNITNIKGGAHTVIGTITTSLDLDDGRFHGSIASGSMTDSNIARGEKVYLMKPTSADYAEIYIYPSQ